MSREEQPRTVTEIRRDELEAVMRDIGRFVMQCSTLEWAAFESILHLDPDGDKLADQEFARRVDALLVLSKKHNLPAGWILLWQRVRSLIEDRKDIVHNPLWVDIWSSNATGEVRFGTPEIRRFRKRARQTKKLTAQFIYESADKAEVYCGEAIKLLGQLFPEPDESES